MRFDQVATIYKKELLETLRDRRTLVLMLVVPMLIYPLMAVLVVQVGNYLSSQLREKELSIAFSMPPSALADTFAARALEEHLTPVATGPKEARALLDDGVVKASVVVSGASLGDSDNGGQTRVEIYYDSGEFKSQEAFGRLRDIFDALRDETVKRRLERHRLPEFLTQPFQLDSTDLASPARRGAFWIGGVLSFLLITMTLSGAFYSAVDLTAGEKERGTLETLLVTPIGRQEITLGKYLTVLTVSVSTSILNILCMGLTFSNLIAGFEAASRLDFQMGPQVVFWMLLALLPLAALFSAVTIGSSSFARSFKEGQNYLTPIFILVMFPALLPVLPGIELSLPVAAAPVAGPALLFRELLLSEGRIHDLVPQLLVVFASTAIYAAAGLAWAAALYEREEILVREAESSGRQLQRPRIGTDAPARGAALGLFFLLFALFAYLSLNTGAGAGLARVLVLPQVLFLVVPVAAAWWSRHNLARTFSLALPGHRSWLGVPFVTFGGVALSSWVAERCREELGPPEALRQALARVLEEAGPWGSIALIALLPAISEEVLCRGYLLAGFRHRTRAATAAIWTGLLFGALHMELSRVPATAVLGIILALVVIRSGSIYPAMLVHFLNNTAALAFDPEYQRLHGDGALARAAAAVAAPLDGIGEAAFTLGGIASLALGWLILSRRPLAAS